MAAGAGRRMGRPKGLLRRPDGTTFAAAAAALLTGAGCRPVLVTVGARGDEVRAGLAPGTVAVDVPDWDRGPGAGLVRTLREPALAGCEAVLVVLADLPRVTVDGVRAVLAHAAPGALVRAVDAGRPGHPVLLGRRHLPRAVELAASGAGLRALFEGPDVLRVQVEGAADDVDRPGDLPAGTR
nr:NTP transferase domain-containing protein [Kineococcus aurantiacus]